jgi:hypothetical protein
MTVNNTERSTAMALPFTYQGAHSGGEIIVYFGRIRTFKVRSRCRSIAGTHQNRSGSDRCRSIQITLRIANDRPAFE